MKNVSLLLLIFSVVMQVNAQKIERVEPPNWWVGMENTELELMVYGEEISTLKPEIDNKNVVLKSVVKTTNVNYLFITLDISKAEAGTFNINFYKKGKRPKVSYSYELLKRQANSKNREGFNSSDVIYLITPDRFANGDETNDVIKGMNEQGINRKDDYARHGGDIVGITQHLDYIDEMGFTAIWSTPVLTNDMHKSSYHGYAITDLYAPDPRFGTMKEYKDLAKKSKERGLKFVMDHVANHIGLEHWWMKDLPTEDWVNYQKEFENGELVITNHRRTTNQDMYASKKDADLMNEGWFVSSMPDLNQKNPHVAKYLIQNSIWWVETLDLGGIRQDTYPYPDKDFMSDWAGAIMAEYPNFSIVGEEWSYNPLLVGYWQTGKKNKDGYESNLTSTMDFPMQKAIVESLTENEEWDKGLVKMYEGLANDFYYENPSGIMIFPDNHDKARFFTELNENVAKTKMGIGYMLMVPRIPQIYYGTEILMNSTANPSDHGLIRSDFPGGWNGDKVNAFTGEGLSDDEKGMQSFMKKVLNYRKNSKAIHTGKTIHFAPDNAIYVLFRIEGDEIVTVIINKNNEPVNLDLTRFEEIGLTGKEVRNIISEKSFTWNNSLTLSEEGITILTTKL